MRVWLIIFSAVSAISVETDFENLFPSPPKRSNNTVNSNEKPVFDPFANLDIIKNAEKTQNQSSSKSGSLSSFIENWEVTSNQPKTDTAPAMLTAAESSQQPIDANINFQSSIKPTNASNEAELKAYLSWLQSVYLSKLNSQIPQQSAVGFLMPQSQQFTVGSHQDDSQFQSQDSNSSTSQTSVSAPKIVVSPGMYLPVNQANQILKHFDSMPSTVSGSNSNTSNSSSAGAKKNNGFRYGSGYTFQF